MKDIANTSASSKKILKAVIVNHSIVLPDLKVEQAARLGNLYLVRLWIKSMDRGSSEHNNSLKWARYWALVNNHGQIVNLISQHLNT